MLTLISFEQLIITYKCQDASKCMTDLTKSTKVSKYKRLLLFSLSKHVSRFAGKVSYLDLQLIKRVSAFESSARAIGQLRGRFSKAIRDHNFNLCRASISKVIPFSSMERCPHTLITFSTLSLFVITNSLQYGPLSFKITPVRLSTGLDLSRGLCLARSLFNYPSLWFNSPLHIKRNMTTRMRFINEFFCPLVRRDTLITCQLNNEFTGCMLANFAQICEHKSRDFMYTQLRFETELKFDECVNKCEMEWTRKIAEFYSNLQLYKIFCWQFFHAWVLFRIKLNGTICIGKSETKYRMKAWYS